VDVLDTGRFPLANFPHFAGLTLDQVSVCLKEFASSPKLGGLVITEVNPDHDPDGQLMRALTQVVAGALAT
jgi:arginase